MNALLKVAATASLMFAAATHAQPVDGGSDARRVLDNYEFLLELYGECSEGDFGIGDSCDRLLDPREQVQEKLEEINTISLRKGWFVSQPAATQARIRTANNKLHAYLLRIMKRKEENISKLAEAHH